MSVTITASLVNDLRAKTGQGMMECKKMLTETGGDIEKAIDAFRKKGVKASLSERIATEGRVTAHTAADHKSAAIVEVNCNTDFTAKSDAVAVFAETACLKLLAGVTDLAADAEIKAALTVLSQTTGENVVLGRTALVKGDFCGSYLYTTAGKGKTAVVVQLSGEGAHDDVVKALGLHVTAVKPLALTREEIPADVVAREKAIAVEMATASGKPQAIAEKIADGKMVSFYAERVLPEQVFINPEVYKGSVGDMLKAKKATLHKYVRIEVGQA